MRRQGLGTRDWGLGLWLVMGLAATLGTPAFSQQRPLGSEESELRIAVRVYNFAPISERDLDAASQVTARILRKAGVRPDWQLCAAAEGQMPEACNAPMAADEVAVRIVRRPKLTKGALGCSECGTAIEDSSGLGIYATLVYDCFNLLPRTEDLLPSFILGTLMAHEIGHLLLAGEDHSPQGIMRAQMRDRDWKLAAVGALVFTPDQADRIRSEVSRRTGSVATVAARSQR
jgi:hypothetical protein